MRAIAALVLLIAAAQASVTILDPTNFDDILDGSRNVLIEFYAPWCGHCKNLAPVYEQLGDAFGHADSVVIASVDADKHRQLGQRYGVTGFPTIKFFPKGSTDPTDYKGGRDLDSFVSFIRAETGVNAKIVQPKVNVVNLDESNFDSIISSGKHVMVEFYAPWCGHCKTLSPKYEKVATAFTREKDVIVAAVDADKHKEIGGRFGISGFPTLKYFAPSASTPENYDGGRTEDDLVSFLNHKAGTQRTVSGDLSSQAGRTPQLDALARRFMNEESNRDNIIEEAKKLPNSDWYVKMMQKVAKSGNSYVASEIERSSRLLGGSLTAEKADEIQIRRNVLQSFN